jgi:hypothetical protein
MTNFEAALAEHNVMEDIYAELDMEAERKEEELKDPATAFELINECENEEEEYFQPVTVLNVLETYFSGGMFSTSIRVKASVKCSDNIIRTVTAHFGESNGSRMEPPEADGWLEWDTVKIKGKEYV